MGFRSRLSGMPPPGISGPRSECICTRRQWTQKPSLHLPHPSLRLPHHLPQPSLRLPHHLPQPSLRLPHSWLRLPHSSLPPHQIMRSLTHFPISTDLWMREPRLSHFEGVPCAQRVRTPQVPSVSALVGWQTGEERCTEHFQTSSRHVHRLYTDNYSVTGGHFIHTNFQCINYIINLFICKWCLHIIHHVYIIL